MGSVTSVTAIVLFACFTSAWTQTIDLPTGKQLVKTAPGDPRRLNSLPMTMAASPDGRYVVTVNAGYGTVESGYLQSLAVTETSTGKVTDFPDERMTLTAKQTMYSGLAFSRDGRRLYATVGSTTDPNGTKAKDLGNGILVYSFHDGVITPERVIKIPLQQLAAGRRSDLLKDEPGNQAISFPAAIAVFAEGAAERLLVADNLSDDALVLDPESGKVLQRFDLSESNAVPSTYPVDVRVSQDGRRAYVALWNASEVVELDLHQGVVARKLDLLKPSSPIAPGTHPSAMQLSPDGATLYVALTNRDAVAAIHVAGGAFAVKGYFDTRLPGQTYFGAEPETLAVNADGTRLYIGNAMSDSVAVVDTRRLTAKAAKRGLVEPIGFFPTEWMPMSMMDVNGKLYVATAKGKGTGPNNFAQREIVLNGKRFATSKRTFTYIPTLLYGSLAVLNPSTMENDLPTWTSVVLESNRMKSAEQKLSFANGQNPIKHVIYIIKENRTYDQLFGDLQKDGKPFANGDPSLTMYGADITPNQHAMAMQYGVMDNFYDSGEVSGEGHTWSTSAIGTDYLDKTWQANYGRGQRTYDYEGMVADGFPIEQHIPDVNEPASGYLWGDVARHGKTLYHFGEFIESTFCSDKKPAAQHADSGAGIFDNKLNPCERVAIQPGEAIPEAWGGGASKWRYPIPLLAGNTATKPELVGNFAPEYPNFNLRIPDQLRANIFLRHLDGWIGERKAGKDNMPNFILLRLGNDHTNGTTPGGPTPKSLVADNDLAIGRVVDAVSHSAYWDDTAFFILEDDAQNGADHVDAHRSIALVVSKYAPRAKDGGTFLDGRFYTTVSMVRTMEMALDLPPMNNNDAFTNAMEPVFSGPGDQPPFTATYANRDNNLIYAINEKTAPGAKASMKMDFRRADRADAQKLNIILWQDAMGDKPAPAQLKVKLKKKKDDDDD
ncbi:Lactonase, 7-bladed beta-propeller [Granulicella rosea]|uniref:Lactonase, 7-bladed beta-propeller n=1 Tax=Granulicella rosea TaxID=474952 RepID=A0A239MK33_9BACT|nr:beta-propeller fold lactonase family protein [Granulicella rosea]SNT42129.1 Lactonase, 7-bladed beta-propeller [Granulicella rosea]